MYHPTQKPVALGRYLIRTYTAPGEVVLDNAFGSGSFLVAAALEGRRYFGIERNEDTPHRTKEPVDLMKVARERLDEADQKVANGEALPSIFDMLTPRARGLQ